MNNRMVLFIKVTNKVYNLSIEDAVEKMGESKCGLYWILIYANLQTFRNGKLSKIESFNR
jgi:hypothetical protein